MIKINELAKTLKDKGIAPTSEEATKMAQGFISKEEVPSQKAASEDRLEISLERMQRKMNSEIMALKEKDEQIMREIESLKKQMSRQASSAPAKPAEEQKKLPKVTEDKNQRIGSLKPGDVSIEEYFYFGDKRNANR